MPLLLACDYISARDNFVNLPRTVVEQIFDHNEVFALAHPSPLARKLLHAGMPTPHDPPRPPSQTPSPSHEGASRLGAVTCRRRPPSC